tara:strand:+ start:1717 stop:2808 length:1092 start_codon:yes stop_codon:yes gene_type:complete
MNFIFGAGSNGLSFLSSTKLKINYFIDNDRNLWGKKFNSIKCISPTDLRKRKINKIIIATPAIENVKSQLDLMNIDKKKILISPELLINLHEFPKNNFLVSANGINGGIYKLNISKNRIKRVFKGSIRGIVKVNDTYICADENEGILILNRDFKVINKKKLDYMSNPHCLDFDQKNQIIYVNITALDCVYKISYPSLKILKKIYIFKKNFYDAHHINSIKYQNDNLYLTMFSLKGIFRNDIWNDGAIIKYNLKSCKKKIITKNLFQPHSIQVVSKILHVCNSMKFEILLNLQKKIRFNGYARGLLVKKEYILVGMSKVRRLDRFSQFNKHISQDAGVIFLNRVRNTSNFFKFPTSEIYDIIEA